jgi:hypothetical protein
MISDHNSTAFAIVGYGFIPQASRGITCKFEPIKNGAIHYDVWGVAHSTARPAFQLFQVTLTCEDVWPPGFASLQIGERVTVHGTDEFIQPSSAAQYMPSADGVLTYYNASMQPVAKGNGDVWLRYRPLLVCLVEDFSIRNDEWGGVSSWMIRFKETR